MQIRPGQASRRRPPPRDTRRNSIASCKDAARVLYVVHSHETSVGVWLAFDSSFLLPLLQRGLGVWIGFPGRRPAVALLAADLPRAGKLRAVGAKAPRSFGLRQVPFNLRVGAIGRMPRVDNSGARPSLTRQGKNYEESLREMTAPLRLTQMPKAGPALGRYAENPFQPRREQT